MRGSSAPPIMADQAPPERPDSFGWLRRPDHDAPGGEAWELPDGRIRIITRLRQGENADVRGRPSLDRD
ncbi:hypothetical protein [uncultured Enterovirga sp.]|uniref:hypothetical protein n=1 Tax=uncultured Enterovirga sp. TaxID=2026352 RepID=UPI0035CB181B